MGDTTRPANSTSGNELTLIVQVGRKYVRASVMGENILPIPLKEEGGCSTIPFQVGYANNYGFIYGYRTCSGHREIYGNAACFKKWTLGYALTNEENNPTQHILIDNFPYKPSNEFLYVIFFKYLKALAEKITERKHPNLKSISSVIFSVPVWIGSLGRQLLKDAAEIAGFTNHRVVNDTTMLCYIHSGCTRFNKKASTAGDLICISENFGNITMAHCTGAWGKMLSCVTVIGTTIKSHDFEANCRKQRFRRIIKIKDKNVLKQRRIELVKIVGEELSELMSGKNLAAPLNIVISYDDSSLLPVILEGVNEEVTVYQNFGLVPADGQGNEVSRNTHCSPVIVPSHFCLSSGVLCDLLVSPIFRSCVRHGASPIALVEGGEELSSEITFKTSVEEYDSCSEIYQSTLVHEFPCGALNISKYVMFMYRNIEAEFTVSKEGIVNFKCAHAVVEDGKRINLESSYYSWRSQNSRPSRLVNVAKDVLELFMDGNAGYQYKKTKSTTYNV